LGVVQWKKLREKNGLGWCRLRFSLVYKESVVVQCSAEKAEGERKCKSEVYSSTVQGD